MNVQAAEPILRVDGGAKVSGVARYAADIRLPGMLVGASLRSPVPHARICSIDASAARALPGVRAVLTAADLPTVLVGKGLHDMPLLARDRVRFIGEKVAAVAADSRDIAEEAIGAIQVEYDELPAIFDAEAAIRPDAPVLHPDRDTYGCEPDYAAPPLAPEPNVNSLVVMVKGDVEEGFRQSVHVSEDEFRLPMQHVGFIEPHACTVAIDPDGTVRVWSCIKEPFGLAESLVHAIGVPLERIVVMPTYIGGDFGGKGFLVDEALAYYLARATGRPIRMAMSMNEEFLGGIPRHAARIQIRSGVDADGNLLARDVHLLWDTGAYAAFRRAVTLSGSQRAAGGYRIPHVRIVAQSVWTNHLPCGSMRAPGQPQVTFACESHTDLLARRIGMDPVELRRRNLLRDGDEVLEGELIRGSTARTVLDRAASAVGWGEPLPPSHGRGLAFSERGTGGGPASVAVEVDAQGQVVVHTGVPEVGTGAHTMIQQVVARVLDVPPALVRVQQGDTASGPFDQGSRGSRVTNATGGAAASATERLRRRLCRLAAEVLGWQEETVQIEDGAFVSTDGRFAFEDLAGRLARLEGGAIVEEVSHRARPGAASFACHAAEVSVDRDTGHVVVERVVAVHDVGHAINPVGLSGQIEGGLIQGLGQALMESLGVRDGQVEAINFGDYRIPNVMDVPPLSIELVEEGDGPGPFGAKGIGEISATPIAAAIANAVEHAVGVRISNLPITAEKVLAALR